MLYFKKLKGWEYPALGLKYKAVIKDTEIVNGLPENLLGRLLQQESDFNPNAYNKSGASGIAQIVPRWHPEVKNPYDADEAIKYSGKYIKKLYDHFGYWDLALAAYNWGWGNVNKLIKSHGSNGFDYMPTETKNYVREILADVKI